MPKLPGASGDKHIASPFFFAFAFRFSLASPFIRLPCMQHKRRHAKYDIQTFILRVVWGCNF
jgi:hypothetical protein